MKNLNELGLKELTNEELLKIEGGNIFSKAYEWFTNAIDDFCNFLGL